MKREGVCKQFGRSACDAVDYGGMTDYALVNGNASVWETGPFLSQALRGERAECRHPSMDPWTVQRRRTKSQRVATEEEK